MLYFKYVKYPYVYLITYTRHIPYVYTVRYTMNDPPYAMEYRAKNLYMCLAWCATLYGRSYVV